MYLFIISVLRTRYARHALHSWKVLQTNRLTGSMWRTQASFTSSLRGCSWSSTPCLELVCGGHRQAVGLKGGAERSFKLVRCLIDVYVCQPLIRLLSLLRSCLKIVMLPLTTWNTFYPRMFTLELDFDFFTICDAGMYCNWIEIDEIDVAISSLFLK